MINSMRKWLITFLFTLISLSCLAIPSIALSDDIATNPSPTEPQPEEEPECE